MLTLGRTYCSRYELYLRGKQYTYEPSGAIVGGYHPPAGNVIVRGGWRACGGGARRPMMHGGCRGDPSGAIVGGYPPPVGNVIVRGGW